MTPEARAFIQSTVQHLKDRMFAPRYALLMRAESFQFGQPELPTVIWWRDMMLLGSVLLPEPGPDGDGNPQPFYLDDPAVRNLIDAELDVPLRRFARRIHVPSWMFYIAGAGAHRGPNTLVRRFYTTSTVDNDFGGLYPISVPNQAEKDAEGSTIPADATVLPDFEPVTDQQRYSALGL